MRFKLKTILQDRRFLPAVLVFAFSYSLSITCSAQWVLYDSCHQATPVCGSNIYTYTVGGSPVTVAGNECCLGDISPQCCADYGCLASPGSAGNPRWFFFKVLTSGNITFNFVF